MEFGGSRAKPEVNEVGGSVKVQQSNTANSSSESDRIKLFGRNTARAESNVAGGSATVEGRSVNRGVNEVGGSGANGGSIKIQRSTTANGEAVRQ